MDGVQALTFNDGRCAVTSWANAAWKISKIGTTRCQILRLKCTTFDFRWSLLRSPEPLAVFKRPTSKWREGEGKGRRRGDALIWEFESASDGGDGREKVQEGSMGWGVLVQ